MRSVDQAFCKSLYLYERIVSWLCNVVAIKLFVHNDVFSIYRNGGYQSIFSKLVLGLQTSRCEITEPTFSTFLFLSVWFSTVLCNKYIEGEIHSNNWKNRLNKCRTKVSLNACTIAFWCFNRNLKLIQTKSKLSI